MPFERRMCVREKFLRACRWVRSPLNLGRLFLLVAAAVIFLLVAVHGYRSEAAGERSCAFNRRTFTCCLLFFCSFVAAATSLTFLGLQPYLAKVPAPGYLQLVCLAELATGVIWLFVWALLSFFLLEQWIQSEPSSANVHSTRAIIVFAFGGAGCWVLMVVNLTRRFKEVRSAMGDRDPGLYASRQQPVPTNPSEAQRSAGVSGSAATSV